MWNARCENDGSSSTHTHTHAHARTHAHTHKHTRLTALCLGLPGWAGTRKVKPIGILLKQETVSGSGISWAIRKSAPRSRQITTSALHHSVFYRPDAVPAARPTASKHWTDQPASRQKRENARRQHHSAQLMKSVQRDWPLQVREQL